MVCISIEYNIVESNHKFYIIVSIRIIYGNHWPKLTNSSRMDE